MHITDAINQSWRQQHETNSKRKELDESDFTSINKHSYSFTVSTYSFALQSQADNNSKQGAMGMPIYLHILADGQLLPSHNSNPHIKEKCSLTHVLIIVYCNTERIWLDSNEGLNQSTNEDISALTTANTPNLSSNRFVIFFKLNKKI